MSLEPNVRIEMASPWPSGARSLYEWRAARPIHPDLSARRPSPDLLETLRWPVVDVAAEIDFYLANQAPDYAQIRRDASAIAAAARAPTHKRMWAAVEALVRATTTTRRARLYGYLCATTDSPHEIKELMRWFVRRAPDSNVLVAALACLAPLAGAPDREILDALAGQPDCAVALIEMSERFELPDAERVRFLMRIAATSRGEGRSEAIYALAPHASDPFVQRWLACADTCDASLESVAELAQHLDFSAIDTLSADDPAAVIGWLHLFSRWFEHGLSTTTIRDGVVSQGPPPAMLSIVDARKRFERLLTRLEGITLDGEVALDALSEASSLRFQIQLLGNVPAGMQMPFASRADQQAWRQRLLQWMAQAPHRAQVDRVLRNGDDRRFWLIDLPEEVWSEDPWVYRMARLRAGRLGELWITLSKTRTREQMTELAAWAQVLLSIDDDGTQHATPLRGIGQPGVRAGGSAAFRDPIQVNAAHQTLRLVLAELKRWSGVGEALVLAGLRSSEPQQEAAAVTTLDQWSEADRNAVLARLPRKQ